MTKIIPGILEKDFSEIQKKVQLVKPHVDRVHIDILDGTFVPYESFCNPAELRTLPITLELHLMIQEDGLKQKEIYNLAMSLWR